MSENWRWLHVMLELLGLGAACSASAQGLITFANRNLAAGINAPVTFLGDVRPGSPLGGAQLASGPSFLAQLAVNGTPVGSPVPFRTASFAGYVSATVVDAGVPGGTAVTVTMLAWAAELGSSYADAVAKGIGMVGTSANLTITAIAVPGVPADLTGLQPFNLSAIIPEPSPAGLAMAAAVALGITRMARRRRPGG
jgi:hypothetical protein